jgi:hypothetical protein
MNLKRHLQYPIIIVHILGYKVRKCIIRESRKSWKNFDFVSIFQLLWHLLTVYPITFFAQSLIRKKRLRSIFFDRNILKTLMSLMSLMTHLSRYRCRYLLTALELLSSIFRLDYVNNNCK